MTEPAAAIGHVHVCHAHADAAYARSLADFLTRSGVPAKAHDEPDSDWRLADSRERVKESAAVVVVMTQAADKADHVEHEVRLAARFGRPLVALLLSGSPLLILHDRKPVKVPRRDAPPAHLVDDLRTAVGAPQAPIAPWNPDGRKGSSRSRVVAVAVASAVAAALMAGGATALMLDRNGSGKDPQADPTSRSAGSASESTSSSASPSSSPTPSVPAGTVQITSHVDGQVVDRCERFSGLANLEPTKTMLFAKNRAEPPDTDWYFDFVGGYRNGFVPANWTGTMYFGTATRQSYDLFILVMDVQEAERFWSEHQSADGQSAMSKTRPSIAPAAHVRVRQGTLDDC
jgi:hypothetical protein